MPHAGTPILRPGFQRAQLVPREGCYHENRKITVGLDLLQALHHLESVHAGHLKIEQDQVVTILAVKFAALARIDRRHYGYVASIVQHLLQQRDIGLLIVNDQDAGLKQVR